jgi:hypothetical protein
MNDTIHQEETTLYCANHPQRETSLRCNRCEKPICVKCAVLTPTGYRCKECVRGQQKVFETATLYDYGLGIPAAAVLAFIGGLIVPRLGWFTIFLAPVAGVIIGEAVRVLTRRRRAPRLFLFIAAATAIGSLLPVLSLILSLLLSFQGAFGALWGLLWYGVYTFIVTSTVYYRISGITIGR